MRARLRLPALLPLFLAACGYEAPLDTGHAGVLNSIEGTVVIAGDTPPGPVFVALYDAADPPPPLGTGGPITFAAVPADAFTGDGAGIQSAAYAITRVADGDYLVSALMDMDGDFQPRLVSNAGGTCGDWRGGHVTDLVSATPAAVTVAGGELRPDVSVFVAAEYTTERPGFRFTDATVVRSDDPETYDPFISVAAEGIHSSLITLEGPYEGDGSDAAESCETTFWVTVLDEDGDGAPDLHWLVRDLEEPPDLAYAIWPRVYAEYQAAEGELAPGERIVTELIILPDFLFSGAVPLNVPTPMAALTAAYPGQAVRILPDGSRESIEGDAVPAGDWAVTLVAHTGQTWRVPNEAAAAPVAESGWDASTQGELLHLQ